MDNQGRKPEQEEDSRFIMAYCLIGTIIILILYTLCTALK